MVVPGYENGNFVGPTILSNVKVNEYEDCGFVMVILIRKLFSCSSEESHRKGVKDTFNG